jgi:NAD-dependent DNA ligase
MVTIPASNRQLKVIRFFEMPIPENMPAVEAARTIKALLVNPGNAERWDKYVYLTGDVSSESADPMPFDPAALARVVLPPGWTSQKAERKYREETAARLLKNGMPYDAPSIVVFKDRIFVFTGGCEFGIRTRCEEAVVSRGGQVSNWVTHVVDYIVVGPRRSKLWSHRSYGSKIETAVVERSIHGKPTIITEKHWRSFL